MLPLSDLESDIRSMLIDTSNGYFLSFLFNAYCPVDKLIVRVLMGDWKEYEYSAYSARRKIKLPINIVRLLQNPFLMLLEVMFTIIFDDEFESETPSSVWL